jgi:hypothetical protein
MTDTGVAMLADISRTPLSSVAQDSCFIAAEATRCSAHHGVVDVYRTDPEDPKPYNIDRYQVWENLAKHPELPEMICRSDTRASPQLTEYLQSHVFMIKQESKGASWHWQDENELPKSIRIMIGAKDT